MGTKNDHYNLLVRNCLQITMNALSEAKLNDGTKVPSIMEDELTSTKVIPNSAKIVFEANFYNNAFTKKDYTDQLQSLLNSYNKNWFTRFIYGSNLDKIESLLSP